jgi:hypothetical protein
MSRPRLDTQLYVGPMEVGKSEAEPAGFRKSESAQRAANGAAASFRKSESDDAAFQSSESDSARLSSALLKGSFDRAGLTPKDVAHICGVSRSLVDKWLDPDVISAPSFIQLLRLPPSFHLALNREVSKHYGFGREALLRAIYALGDLAMALED